MKWAESVFAFFVAPACTPNNAFATGITAQGSRDTVFIPQKRLSLYPGYGMLFIR